MASPDDVLIWARIHKEMESLPQWRYSGDLRTVLKCPTSAVALKLFATIGELAQKANHHPDVDWRYDTLFIATSSHDAGGQITARDIALARAISAAAVEAGAVARPDGVVRT